MKKLMCILLAAVMLTACRQVPQNVKDRNEELDSMRQAQSSQTSDESSPVSDTQNSAAQETGDLDYIRAHLKEDAGKKYGTITIKNASAGDAKSMPTYKVQVGANPNYDIKKLGAAFFGEDYESKNKTEITTSKAEPAPQEPVKTTDPNAKLLPEEYQMVFKYDNIWQIDDLSLNPGKKGTTTPDDFRSVAVGAQGMLSGRQTMQKDLSSFYENYHYQLGGRNDPVSVKAYYPCYEEALTDSYKMTDGNDWAVSDAVAFAENKANELFAFTDPVKYTYKVYRVDVAQCKQDTFKYLFWFRISDEQGNICECDSYSTLNVNSKQVCDGKRFSVAPWCAMECIAKDEIFYIKKDFSFKQTEKVSDNDKLLTLGAAAKKLEKELAEHINLACDTAELCYVMTCDQYPKNKYDFLVLYDRDMCLKTCELTVRPYWCFKIGNNNNVCWNSGANYYVDAVTGEVIIIMNKNGA